MTDVSVLNPPGRNGGVKTDIHLSDEATNRLERSLQSHISLIAP